MKSVELIVFDWDGTLADSISPIVAGMQAAIAQLGLPPRSDAQIGGLIGLGITDGLRRLYPELEPARLLRKLMSYRNDAPARQASLPLFPGALDALETLHAAGYRLAVATGRQRTSLQGALDAHPRLQALMAITRCADEAADKPDPAMLMQILAETGVPAARAVMVGDTEYDMEMAVAMGMPALGVSCGGHDVERLRAAGATAVLESVAALPTWLGVADDGAGSATGPVKCDSGPGRGS